MFTRRVKIRMDFIIILGIFMFSGMFMGFGISSIYTDDWNNALEECKSILIPSEYDDCNNEVKSTYGMLGFLPLILAVAMMLPAGLFRPSYDVETKK